MSQSAGAVDRGEAALDLFSAPVAGWFRSAFGRPTPPQAQGWPAIARGEHVLILSPTGSGKTLTAFLWGLDVLYRELSVTPEPEGRPRQGRQRAGGAAKEYEPGVRVLYISPLKALNNDVERNLQVPLVGIRAEARRQGVEPPSIRVAVRTGDTPGNERQSMVRRPPHILITTPESLYLMLTSERAREMFATTHTVIVDEIHTLVGTKRGAHLALTLERLSRLTRRSLQRVGLSATVRPLENAARFLGGQEPIVAAVEDPVEARYGLGPDRVGRRSAGQHGAGNQSVGELDAASDLTWQQGTGDRSGGQQGIGLRPRPVTVVDAGYRKPLDLSVTTMVDDFRNLPGNTIWSAVIPEVTRLIEAHRTTLIFCNNRRLAERTADRVNEQRLLIKTGQPDAAEDASGLNSLSDFSGLPGSNGSNGISGLRGGVVADDAWAPAPLAARSAAVRPASVAVGQALGMFAVGVDRSQLEAAGLQPIRAHHGSMSKEARLEMEGALKQGTLPALVATSSLELGIDIGEIDLVVHLQSPKSVSSGLQRVGRSGHLVGQTSRGRIFATHVEDVMEAAAVAWGMLRGEIENTHTPENPLDILAQQVMAMVGVEDWAYADMLEMVRGAYPFRNLSETAFRSVVEMLSGKYPSSVSRYLQARLSWDRVNDRLAALPGSRLLAIQSGGTIPDRGAYSLVLSDRKTRVGELDEEFVFETRTGDTFLLGSQVWRVLDITEDRVIAEPAPGEVPRMPFWRGDFPWRPYDLGRRIGAFRRGVVDFLTAISPAEVQAIHDLTSHELEALTTGSLASGSSTTAPPARKQTSRRPSSRAHSSNGSANGAIHVARPGAADVSDGPGEQPIELGEQAVALLRFLRHECALDRNSIVQVVRYVAGQMRSIGQIATDRCVIVEVFDNPLGDPEMVVHSPFGGRVNGPWGIALAGMIREQTGIDAQVISNDDGVLLRFADADVPPPAEMVSRLTSGEARERLIRDLPSSAVFGAQFRMNAARALLLPRQAGQRRTSLWLSRLRAKDLQQAVERFDDFPIMLETYRDCLRDVMDLDGLTEVLDQIQRGEIQVLVHETELPSPVSRSLDYRLAMQYVYEYDAPRGERQIAALSLNRALLADLLQDGTLADLLKPDAVAEVTARVGHTGAESRARTAEELAQVLYELGDLSEAEVAERCVSPGAGHMANGSIEAAGAHAGYTNNGSFDALNAASGNTAALDTATGRVGAPGGTSIPAEGSALDGYRMWLSDLAASGRVVSYRLGGEDRWVHAEREAEYARLQEHPLPVLRRRLMHAGPTPVAALASRYGLDEALVRQALEALGAEVVAGRFTPGSDQEQWIDRRNLEQMHRRTLTFLRKEVQPVPVYSYAEFLRRWQKVASALRAATPTSPAFGRRHQSPPWLNEVSDADDADGDPHGALAESREAALHRVLQQLRGFAVSGVAWERDVLPIRLPEADPALLSGLCQSGELLWMAEGGRDARRARVRFFFRGEGGLFLERKPDPEVLDTLEAPARAVYDFLLEEGAALLADVADGTGLARAALQPALVDLVLAGLVTNDTLGALRAVLGYEPAPAQRSAARSSLEGQLAALRGLERPANPFGGGRSMSRHSWGDAKRRAREAAFLASSRPTGAGWMGRWSLVHRFSLLGKPLADDERALRQARQLLQRWGVVTKACLDRESASLRWETICPVLATLEMRGEVRRGYFVEGLPGVQFALPDVVEQLRAVNGERSTLLPGEIEPVVLSAVDPAQLFGPDGAGGALRFARVPSSAVALAAGEPVAVMEDGGTAVDAVTGHPALVPALRALAAWWAARISGASRLRVERWQSTPVLDSPGVPFLEAAGFVRDSTGMTWSGR